MPTLREMELELDAAENAGRTGWPVWWWWLIAGLVLIWKL